MNTVTESVFIEALSLPIKERAKLAEKLLLSLEPEEGSPAITAAWKFEALVRCRAFDAGELNERSAVDVLNDAERKAK